MNTEEIIALWILDHPWGHGNPPMYPQDENEPMPDETRTPAPIRSDLDWTLQCR